MQRSDVVITGLGVVSPCGIGIDEFWANLLAQRSGIGPLDIAADTDLPIKIGGEIRSFDPRPYVVPRKRLKLMCREMQTGYAAAVQAAKHAGLDAFDVDPDRFAVVFGGEMYHDPAANAAEACRNCLVDGEIKAELWGAASTTKLNPLTMLRNLPNVCACHIAIGQDARGPCNTIVADDVSSLLAVMEGARLIRRGAADVVMVGGSGTRINLTRMLKYGFRGLSRQTENPITAAKPFDAQRDGAVLGEGAGALVLESRAHAVARNATIRAQLLAGHSGFQGNSADDQRRQQGIGRSIATVLRRAELQPDEIGHVNAHASGMIEGDRIEAHAIEQCLAGVPVTAPKSYFGSLGAGSGAVELAVSVMAVAEGVVPVTLNFHHPDPECPVNVINREPLNPATQTAIVLNQTPRGQLASVLIASES